MDKIEEHKFNMKKTWMFLKETICKNYDKSSVPKMFEINNKIMSNPKEIADSFNNFFSNIGQKLNEEIPRTNKSYSDYVTNQSNSIVRNSSIK